MIGTVGFMIMIINILWGDFFGRRPKKSPHKINGGGRKNPRFRKKISLRSIFLLHRGLKSYAAPRLAIRLFLTPLRGLPSGAIFVQTAGFASKPGSNSLKSYAAPRLADAYPFGMKGASWAR